MNIILSRNDGGQAQVFRVSPAPIAGLAGLLLLLAGLGVWSAFDLLKASPSANADVQLDELQQGLHAQRQALAELRRESNVHLDALALQMGELQARSLRLEALADRVAAAANVDLDELRTDQIAIGGAEPAEQAWAFNELEAGITDLETRFAAQDMELEALAQLVTDREAALRRMPAGRPIQTGWLSSYYGKRADPFDGSPDWHPGIDFAGKHGAPIIAVADGVVTWAKKRFNYGLMVEIDHGNGYITRYAHMHETDVAVGERVRAGDVIGAMGSSGRSTGPHVHFEVWENGKRTDPIKFVRAQTNR